MKRLVLLACMFAGSPAFALNFTETPVCTVTHEEPDTTVVLTFDPATSIYTIALSRVDQTWAGGPNFRITFVGGRSFTIGTDQQVLTDSNKRVAVSNSGFDNVLDGIQFNDTMIASLGDDSITISLEGAAEPMIAFRQCPTVGVS